MTAKEIFFDFCKENNIFELVQRKIRENYKRYHYSPIQMLSEESFHRVLFKNGETNIFTYKLGYRYIKYNRNTRWKKNLRKWNSFKRNNIILKVQILKDGDTIEYYDKRYPNEIKDGIVTFVDLDKKKTFICNYDEFDIGDIIRINGNEIPLDIFYIKQKGKIYGN